MNLSRCCCGYGTENCLWCINGRAPQFYQVDIAGFVDTNCTGSGAFNGSWLLGFQGIFFSNCIWRRDLSSGELAGAQDCISSPASCFAATSANIAINIRETSGQKLLIGQVQIDPVGAGSSYIWKKDMGSDLFDCFLSGESLPFDTQFDSGFGDGCIPYDASSATFTVTAL